MFTFTATTEQRRIFLIGAATVAAIALTITVVRLSTCSSTDKPLSKRQLASLSTPVPFPPSLPPPRDSPLEGFFNGQERHELAKTLRQRAATAANADDFARAAELYTRALAAAPEEDATLYANRGEGLRCGACAGPARRDGGAEAVDCAAGAQGDGGSLIVVATTVLVPCSSIW